MQLEQHPRSAKLLLLVEQGLKFQYTKLPCLQNRTYSEAALEFLGHSQSEIVPLLVPLVVTRSINLKDFTGEDGCFIETEQSLLEIGNCRTRYNGGRKLKRS